MNKDLSRLSFFLLNCLLFAAVLPLPHATHAKPDIKKVDLLAERLASNVDKAQATTAKLEKSGEISTEQASGLKTRLAAADEAIAKLNERTNALQVDGRPETAADREEVSKLLVEAAKELSKFKSEGVAGLNPQTQIEFDSVMDKMSKNLRKSAAAVDCVPLNANCMKCDPDPPGAVICVP